MSGICITAGFDKALNAIAIAELLRRNAIVVDTILVVTPYNIKRLRAMVRQRGQRFIIQSAKRLTGFRSKTKDAVQEFLDEHAIEDRSLKAWANKHGATYQVVQSLNHPDSLASLTKADPDWVVYGGGGILRKGFITAAKSRILNAHAGPLPEVRGMNACEWSLLLGLPPQVTIHLINRGIDTGGIINRYPIPVHGLDTIDALRARATAVGIKGIVETVMNPPSIMPKASIPCSRQCYVLAPVLKELLIQKLERQQVPTS